MRPLSLFVLVCGLLLGSTRAWAQETLGLLRFDGPESWERHDLEKSVEFVAVDAETGAWGKVRVWGPTVSTGSRAKDFKEDYDTIVVGSLHPKVAPKTATKTLAGGWQRTEARVAFTFNGRPGRVVFHGYSDGKLATSAVGMWSGEGFEPQVEAFLAA